MSRGTFIENEQAYERAIARRIRQNAAKTARAKWMAMPGAARADEFLFETGEFEQVETTRDPSLREEYEAKRDALDPAGGYWQDRDLLDQEYGVRRSLHPAVRAALGDFYAKMRDQVLEWGGLTEKQNAAVLALIERAEARVIERDRARAEQAAADAERSGWIGAVGERRVLQISIRMIKELSGTYGISYLHVCHDADGNVVVYKGTNRLGERGDTVTVKATVKDHDVRDGVKQTKISRPKMEA